MKFLISVIDTATNTGSGDEIRAIDEFNDSSDDNTGPSICLLTTRGIHSYIYLSIYLSIHLSNQPYRQRQTDHIHHPTHLTSVHVNYI